MALALSKVPRIPDKRVLVGNDTADDAGVFQISPARALVQTVDLLSPVVDDPYTFGRIAAVNSLSDVYAMGGKPLSALCVVGFPSGGDPEMLGEIIRGGQDAVVDAGAALIGGHTFQDSEIRFGLAVTGEIDPRRIITNVGARPGDKLVLTKPLGVGVIIQALVDRGSIPAEMLNTAVTIMTASNRRASEAMIHWNAHACTDVTGFGFIGHCWQMTAGKRIGIKIFADQLPILPAVLELIRDGVVNSGVKMNRNSFERHVRITTGIRAEIITSLFGSETSGGLLIALAPRNAQNIVWDLTEQGHQAVIVGEVNSQHRGTVSIA